MKTAERILHHVRTLPVDLATFWVEPITPSGRGQHAVLEALKTVQQRLPFPLLSIDSDNDSSFINDLMQRYCQQEHIAFGRSRPYRKNDQAHVEQRNWSMIAHRHRTNGSWLHPKCPWSAKPNPPNGTTHSIQWH